VSTRPNSLRGLGLSTGLSLGVIVLALFIVLAVLLPRAEGSTGSVALPDTLPGGYKATDLDATFAGQSDLGQVAKQQRDRLEDTKKAYDGVYDEPVAFRAYTDKTLNSLVGVTVFGDEGDTFGPPVGTSQASDLVRQGDVVCEVTYSQDQSGQVSSTPSSVVCQLPAHEQTIQVAAGGLTVPQVVKLTHDVDSVL
jgi:hypothetical protein